MLFRLRGMEREQFVAMVGKGESSSARRKTGEVSKSEPAPATSDLAANAELFWRGRPVPDDRYGQVALSGEPAPLARRSEASPSGAADAISWRRSLICRATPPSAASPSS
jgi:hypothetical protein